MQCIFLFRDSADRLPTAQDLLKRGFKVSEAALPAGEARGEVSIEALTLAEPSQQIEATGLALAAEPKPHYGDRVAPRHDGAARSGCEDDALAARAEAETVRAGAGA